MAQEQLKYKKSLIQQIQICKKNVFLNDEERYLFMQSRFGVDSTTKLNIDELNLLLDFCKGKINDVPMLDFSPNKEFITEAQIGKIRVLWSEKARDKNEQALLSFCEKIAQFKGLNRVENMLKGKATKVIVALDRMR